MAWLKFSMMPLRKVPVRNLTMPMFNAFWQQNKLIEMRRSEKNEQYIRYGDFRADPVKMRWVRQAAKLRLLQNAGKIWL